MARVPAQRRSWVDLVFAGIDRLPGPKWLYLVGLMGLCAATAALLRLLDGSTEAGVTSPVTILSAATTPLSWAAAYYLARVARASLAAYRPALGELAPRYEELERGLTSMRGWASALALLLGVGVWAVGQFSNPNGWGVRAETSDVTNAVTYALGIVFNVGLAVFAIRAIEQTALIVRIHRESTAVDIWDTAPHRAFSRLTLAIALVLVVPYALYDLIAVWIDGFVADIDIVILVAAVVVAVAVFFLPLIGMHRQLVREKGGLVAANDRAFETAGRRLHEAVADRLADADALNAALQALTAERARLKSISTLPWSHETLSGLLTSIGAPVLLFLITALLSRLLEL